MGLRRWVANGSREGGSRGGVAKWGRENKKYRGICKGDPEGSNYLIKNSMKIGNVGNIGPGRLGPVFKRSVP